MYKTYFNDEITPESANELVDKLHSQEGEIELWFSTCGGDSAAMDFIISYLNSRKEELGVVLTERVCSAGTQLFLDFKGEIKIAEIDYILFHYSDRDLPSKNIGKINVNVLRKQDKQENKIFAKKLKKKKLLTAKQMKQFKKGEDIVIYKKQIMSWKYKQAF